MRPGTGQELLVFGIRRTAEDQPDTGLLGDFARSLREFFGGDEQARARVLDDVGQLSCREPYVHGDQDGAGHGNAVVQLQHHVAVHAKRGHAISGLDARIRKQSRQPMGAVAEFAIGEALLTIDDGGAMSKH